jgi:hypothetical protein
MTRVKITLPREKLRLFCERWKITELSLFGSVLREDFREDSDIDVLVSFSEGAQWTLFDLVQMQDELKEIFGRDVDVVSRRGLESSRNHLRQRAIMESTEVIHVS